MDEWGLTKERAERKTAREHAWRITLDFFRLSQYLALAVALYFIVFDKSIGLQDSNPGLQASLYTLANITVRAWLGYRISVAVLGRLARDNEEPSAPLLVIARAVLVGCVILTSR